MCTLFGIPDDVILESTEETMGVFWDERKSDDVLFGCSYNRTEPDVIKDGITGVVVRPISENEFKIIYGGYRSGTLRVTREGVETMAKNLLTNREEVPNWLLNGIDSRSKLPDVLPRGVELQPTIRCRECDDEFSAREMYTPRGMGPTCEGCWEDSD